MANGVTLRSGRAGRRAKRANGKSISPEVARPAPPPAYRYLRGYCLDPGFSTRLDTAAINEVLYKVPFESLQPGPIGEYVEVIDFDPASRCWYEPVDLREEQIASQIGLPPSEGNPQFHQQLVYAVAMKTIRHFEHALGRKIVWYPRVVPPDPKAERSRDGEWRREYVRRLRIHPHAFRGANAYYDPEKAAVLFGYFDAANQSVGANFPGGLVFTCLSPDVAAHEITHAILDSIHHRYLEDTNRDVAAFHEGFADIVALLQRFTFTELVEDQLFRSGGRLDRYTVLGDLATQFGEALKGNRGALRSMIGRWNENRQWVPIEPKPSDYHTVLEPHDRGALLVATIFDAFQRIYAFRTGDLMRIAAHGNGDLHDGSINRDLAHRLAVEACESAEHLLHVCIRALDYTTPNDISFGDYLRALITADLDIAPEDKGGYRIALIEAFRARGIFPDRVNTFSVESLRWGRPDFTDAQKAICKSLIDPLKEHIRELVDTGDREDLYRRSVNARRRLHDLLEEAVRTHQPQETEAFLNRFGLTSLPVRELFGPHAPRVRFLKDGKPDDSHVPGIEVHTVRPAFRSGRETRQIEQVLITLTQRVTADVGEDGLVQPMVFRGGCSVILNLGSLDTVEFVIQKNIRSHRRFEAQRAYITGETDAVPPSTSLYSDEQRPLRLDLNLLHRG